MCLLNFAVELLSLTHSLQTLALAFYNKFPQVLFDIILFSICGSVGQLAILYNIREFGSLVNTIVTVTRWGALSLLCMPVSLPLLSLLLPCRKFLTIIISVVYYSHPMTPLKWAGTVFVFTGLASEAYRSYKKKHK